MLGRSISRKYEFLISILVSIWTRHDSFPRPLFFLKKRRQAQHRDERFRADQVFSPLFVHVTKHLGIQTRVVTKHALFLISFTIWSNDLCMQLFNPHLFITTNISLHSLLTISLILDDFADRCPSNCFSHPFLLTQWIIYFFSHLTNYGRLSIRPFPTSS